MRAPGTTETPTPPTGRIPRPDRVVDPKMRSNISARTVVLTAGLTLAALAASPASAQDWQVARKGDWIVTGRVTDISSNADDAIVTAAGASTGLQVDVGNDVMPTLGFTYFLTDHISVEAILGATRHEIRAEGGTTDVAVHETWVLPPVVTVQYRPAPEARVSPYVGAGLNYMVFFDGEDRNGFDVNLDDGLGYALQAGADVAVSGPWTVNIDVKKVWFNTDANINGGTLNSDVNLDPLVISLGVGRKF